MFNYCINYNSGLGINNFKTTCIRIGPRFSQTDCNVSHNNHALAWKSELKYLGVHLLSGKMLKFNMQPVKQKFYRSVNGIFSKIVATKDPTVIISLMNSFCVPILLYGLEAFNVTTSCRNSVDFLYNSIFVKIFKIKERNCILRCQYYTNNLPATCQLDLKTLNFEASVLTLKDSLPYLIGHLIPSNDVMCICDRYSISHVTLCSTSNFVKSLLVRKTFEASVEALID